MAKPTSAIVSGRGSIEGRAGRRLLIDKEGVATAGFNEE
jgi:hypothetical protein